MDTEAPAGGLPNNPPLWCGQDVPVKCLLGLQGTPLPPRQRLATVNLSQLYNNEVGMHQCGQPAFSSTLPFTSSNKISSRTEDKGPPENKGA